jgi:hypothetical protein
LDPGERWAVSDLGESIGTVIEGGLLGRAVEPGTGKTAGQDATQIDCSNCGFAYHGHFCPNCGQKAHVHRSLAAIGHDIMHGVLHLDGKLWATLSLLIFKPGALTRRFISGERAKFVSPMAMFLFTVFAMFAVFQMVGISAPTDLPSDNGTSNSTGLVWLDEHVVKKWKKNPGLMLYKLQSNGYKFSWLLILLSTPFVWLVFAWRRKFKAYDHAVFVTYSLSFMSLLFIAISILSTVPGGAGWAAGLFMIAAPLHLYKQLRYAYGLTRFSALWRFFVLLFCTQIVITIFLFTLSVIGAF